MAEYYLKSFVGKSIRTVTAVPVYKRADVSTTPIGTISSGRDTPRIASYIEGSKIGSSYDWFEISFANGAFDTAFIPVVTAFYSITGANVPTSSEVDAKRAEIDSAYAASQELGELEKWAWRGFWALLGLGVAKIATSSIVELIKR